MLAIWSLVPLFSKSSLNICEFLVHVLFEASLGEFWALLFTSILMIHFLYPIYLKFQFLMTPIPVMHAHKIVPLHMFFPLPLMSFTIPRTPYPWDPKLRWLPGLHRHLDDPYSVLLEHLVHPSIVLIALHCTSGLICPPSPKLCQLLERRTLIPCCIHIGQCLEFSRNLLHP